MSSDSTHGNGFLLQSGPALQQPPEQVLWSPVSVSEIFGTLFVTLDVGEVGRVFHEQYRPLHELSVRAELKE